MGLKGGKYSETYSYGQLRLCKRSDSGRWYAVFTNPTTGRRREKSLHTTLKREAERQADVYSAQITSGKIGVADGTAPLEILFTEFVTANDHLTHEGLKRVQSSINVLRRWIAECEPDIRLVKHLTPSHARRFRSFRIETGAARRTVNNDVTNLHSVFLWGRRAGLAGKSPFDYSRTGTIKLFKSPSQDPDTYTKDEYPALNVEAARRAYYVVRDLIIVLANTGMRFGEAANLTSEWLHWNVKTPYIEIRARRNWKPKDPNEIKYIPMRAEVQEVFLRLSAAAKPGTPLFKNKNGNRVAGNHTLARLKRLFPAVGIGSDRRLYWHSWRNFFVIDCLERGVTIPTIMDWVGHDDEQMVIHYSRVRNRDKNGFAEFDKMM